MKIYYTKTQADYNTLMLKLEVDGCMWVSGVPPTAKEWWHGKEPFIKVENNILTWESSDCCKKHHPSAPIINYTAKDDDKMKFTKENVEKVIDEYFLQADLEPCSDLIAEIYNLDGTPEKMVVPKFVADYLEDCKKRNIKLVSALCPFKMGYGKEIELWFDNEDNNRLFALAWINGYEVEKEPLYYIPLPHLETADGIQQVLSKRDTYFASRPNEKLKQRYTKEELAQVPEIYKPYAKPIEGEEEE